MERLRSHAILTGVCINNACESWNNGFRQLVGQAHPSVWKVIESLQLDQVTTSTALVLFAHGQPTTKRVRRETVRHQKLFHNLCSGRHDDDISVEDMLKGIGHTVRLK